VLLAHLAALYRSKVPYFMHILLLYRKKKGFEDATGELSGAAGGIVSSGISAAQKRE
jgi:hypothetical protein